MQAVLAEQEGSKRGKGRPRRPNRPLDDLQGIAQLILRGPLLSIKDAAFLAQVNEDSIRKAIREERLETIPIKDPAGRTVAHGIEIKKLLEYYGLDK
jgi:hypothetical protein